MYSSPLSLLLQLYSEVETIEYRPFKQGWREGLIVHFGQTEAEISPLPGHSKETLQEAEAQIQQIQKRKLLSHLYPSVYFGLESALLSSNNPSCKEYSLLQGDEEAVLSLADQLEKEGVKEIKLKCGHLTPHTLHRLIEKLHPRFRIRLDFNRKWNLKEALSFFSCYPHNHFVYAEEPLSDPNQLVHFPYPFALDETLREGRSLAPLLALPNCKAVILKPTLMYPLPPFPGKQVILTSSYDGPLGIAQIRRLIHRLQLHQFHHGLDTLRYL